MGIMTDQNGYGYNQYGDGIDEWLDGEGEGCYEPKLKQIRIISTTGIPMSAEQMKMLAELFGASVVVKP